MSQFPLTDFLIALTKATNDQVRRANPDKLADKYGISPKHAADLIRYEREQRGIR